MSLHLLPADKVERVFKELRGGLEDNIFSNDKVKHDDLRRKIKQLFSYVDENWIEGVTWPPSAWSVFMQKVKYSQACNIHR